MTIWYSSDNHFSHRNIIKYSNRPFANVDEMNEEIIRRHNSRVKPTDNWYCLGDFCFDKNPDKFLSRMNGKKHLIIGNHDSVKTQESYYWDSVQPYLEISDDQTKIILCHYSFRVWNQSHRGAIALYGHSHGSLPGNNQSLDVGVDCWDFYPVNIHEIKERLKTLPPYKSVDHHK